MACGGAGRRRLREGGLARIPRAARGTPAARRKLRATDFAWIRNHSVGAAGGNGEGILSNEASGGPPDSTREPCALPNKCEMSGLEAVAQAGRAGYTRSRFLLKMRFQRLLLLLPSLLVSEMYMPIN